MGAWDDRRKRWLLGQVVNLKLSLEIIDMTTGRRVELSSERSPYYGAVVGTNRGVESFKKGNAKARQNASGLTKGGSWID